MDETNRRPHNLILDGRKRLMISGVTDVDNFDEDGVSCNTSQGKLLISGSDLKVDKLSLEGGELSVEGKIQSLIYEDPSSQKGGFLSRLLS